MDLTKVVAKMTDVEGGVPRKDRKYLFKRYKQSFTGQELVSWLLSSSFAKSREEGVTFGQALMEQGMCDITAACGSMNFWLIIFRSKFAI